jgi:hypothetical protein
MAERKPPKIRGDGDIDHRGHGEGSKGTRFAAGDGRPRPGRRKGSRDERTIVQAIRNMPVTVKDASGRIKKVTTYDAILMAMRQKALAGDIKAAEALLRRIDRHEPPSVEQDRTADLIAEDQLILDAARRRGLLPHPDDNGGEGGA